MTTQQKVQVGDTEYSVGQFSALKGILAGELVAGISADLGDVVEKLAAFDTSYRSTHTLRVTLGMNTVRGYGIPESAFVTPEGGGEPYVEIPEVPDAQQQFLAIFPDAWKVARAQLLRLIALVLIPNDQLLSADEREQTEEGAVDRALDDLGRLVYRSASLSQLVGALVTGARCVVDEIEEHKEALGELRGSFDRLRNPETPVQDEPTTLAPARVIEEPSAQPSSTSSPEPTAGDEATSSGAVGVSSATTSD